MGAISSSLVGLGIVSIFIFIVLFVLEAKGKVEMEIEIPYGKGRWSGPAWVLPLGFALFVWLIAALLAPF